MIYHIAFFNQQNQQSAFAALQSPTPFHSIAVGQKIHLPQGAFVVVEVTHEFARDNTGNDHSTMKVLCHT